jgi:hypothetical protein
LVVDDHLAQTFDTHEPRVGGGRTRSRRGANVGDMFLSIGDVGAAAGAHYGLRLTA